jgi:O-methyltransferase
MASQRRTAPIALSVPTQPTPSNASELYLDLTKRVLTRVLTAKGMERHTIRARGTKSALLHRFNQSASRLGLEAVRLTPSGADDYLESGDEANNRVEDAETMLGTRQLDHMQRCITDVLTKNVPGDLIETGVWRGGMTIFMRAVLMAYQVTDRKVWVADSFAGLPASDLQHDKVAWQKGDKVVSWQEGEMAVSLDTVKDNFARYGLLDDQVVFLKGFFSDTLPTAPIGQLSILRVDADLYSSTIDVLRNLYSRLSAGGYEIFYDYQNLPDCRRAIDEFRRDHGVTEEICRIDKRAVYWQKQG